MANAFNNSVSDNVNWIKQPFLFKVEDTLANLHQDFKDVLSVVLTGTVDPKDDAAARAEANKLIEDSENADSDTTNNGPILKDAYMADTRLGWNDALNALNQFTEDDDILYPIYTTIPGAGGGGGFGLGRVYAEKIEQHQTILWMSFGLPVYSGFINFIANAVDTEVTSFMRTGASSGLAGGIVSFVLGTASSIFRIPITIARWIRNIAAYGAVATTSRYYDFKPAMPLYYQFVQSIIVELSANMGMFDAMVVDGSDINSENILGSNDDAIPMFLKNNMGDVYAMMQQRASFRYKSRFFNEGNVKSTAEALNKLIKMNVNHIAQQDKMVKSSKINDDGSVTIESVDELHAQMSFVDSVYNTMMGALDFVGFRVEKGTEMNETFSNRTGESSLAQMLNSKSAEAEDRLFTTSAIAESINTATLGFFQATMDAARSAADKFGMGAVANVFLGGSFIDIPDVYQGSDFNASRSFDMELISGDGSAESILQDIYIPLAFWLAGTLPRATGDSSYTHPFYCRCYCKGQFAVPLGMITELSISRGDSEFGWNLQKLPTRVHVSATITDLAPAMYMALHVGGGSGGIFDKLMSILFQNSTFREYLNTLSGLGLADRQLFSKTIARRFSTLANLSRNTLGNPLWWGTWLGDSIPIRTVGNLIPSDSLPRN